MRYVVLIFGILGLGGAGFLAYRWGTDWLSVHTLMHSLPPEVFQQRGAPGGNDAKQFFDVEHALLFLVIGVVFSLFGVILSFFGRRGFSGAALLIVSGVAPGIFFPGAFLFTSCLIVAGIFSLFVRAPREQELDPDY